MALRASAWACLAIWAAPVGAQTVAPGGLALQPSGMLVERLLPENASQAPTFVTGDRVYGTSGERTVVEGEAELRRHDTRIQADKLEHEQANDRAIATGQVRINRAGNVFQGPFLDLKLDTFEGYFESPTFSLLRSGGHGQAERVDFLGENRAVATKASYTTCTRDPGPSWLPDWVVTATSIDFDQENDVGTATNGVLRFKGVPLLAAPYVSFPLSDKRKSGLLPPTINLDNKNGLEVTLPYYLNLSPNRDATLYPTLMTKRGVDLAGEYRYLEPTYEGMVRGAFMPSDQLRGINRWGLSVQHSGLVDVPVGRMSVGLNLNRVGDDNYWRDFPRTSTSLTSRLLANNAVAHWGQGPWRVSAGVYRWQTLQDPLAPFPAPYDRLPSVTVIHSPGNLRIAGTQGWQWISSFELTRFTVDRAASISLLPNGSNDVNGTRVVGVSTLSKTWETPGWYIKPSLQLHARHYKLDATLGNGTRNPSFVIPTTSLDAGLVYERDTQLFGRSLVQTLEPRLYYVNTPYRDQAYLPNYDSAAFDFNLGTIFQPNPYVGNDRIADVHSLTVGATTRLLDAATGAEVLSLGAAQRIRFREQQVVLPGQALVSQGFSDILVGGRLQWSDRWSLNGTVQFNPDTRESVRTTLGARYTPGNYRTIGVAYRLQRGTSEQFDVGWQWPLNDLFGTPPADTQGAGRGLGAGEWYSVGRINYSVPDRKIVDLVAGFEYDGGCYVGRVVLERLQNSSSSANQRILFQLEFVGFSRIGSNPLQTLKTNIPRYQYLREEINPPSRYERYE